MDQSTHQQIKDIIAETLGVDDVSEITPSSEFIADLNASVEEIQQIIKAVEERFDIELGIHDAEELINVAQLIELVDESFI